MAELDAYETYMLTLINRARANPSATAAAYGIDLNEGLATGTISATAKAPLAPNDLLSNAADGHSAWMLVNDVFSHTGSGGSTPHQRMIGAGYAFTGSWSSGENISWRGTTGSLPTSALPSYIEQQHRGLFLSSGHRVNLMNDSFREIGISQVLGDFDGYNASMITQNFAVSGSTRYVTGVVFDDKDSDGFYDPGEGLGGVTVSINGVAVTQTMAAGAYSAPMSNGTATLLFSGGALSGTYQQSVTMASANLGVDVKAAQATPAMTFQSWNGSVWVATTPTAYSGPVTHLDWQMVGTNAAEIITGSIQDDFINLAGGDDAVNGNAGADVIDGGTGSNFLTGGAGTDVFFVDGRSGQTTWSTLTDFTSGEQVSIWGWTIGTSTRRWEASAGANGYAGATLHIDLDGDGDIELSVTFTGLTVAQVGTVQEQAGLLWIT